MNFLQQPQAQFRSALTLIIDESKVIKFISLFVCTDQVVLKISRIRVIKRKGQLKKIYFVRIAGKYVEIET